MSEGCFYALFDPLQKRTQCSNGHELLASHGCDKRLCECHAALIVLWLDTFYDYRVRPCFLNYWIFTKEISLLGVILRIQLDKLFAVSILMLKMFFYDKFVMKRFWKVFIELWKLRNFSRCIISVKFFAYSLGYLYNAYYDSALLGHRSYVESYHDLTVDGSAMSSVLHAGEFSV